MELTHIEDTFIDIGGQFFTSGFDLREQLPKIKALLFDWDGVFNSGRKSIEGNSTYSEVDSVGVDLLRFGFNLAHGGMVKTGIITGETNEACFHWARREHIDSVYSNAKNKDTAFLHFCKSHDLHPSEVAYFFDDVLDVPVARQARIRMAVGRLCNPLFMEYLERNKMVDYFSSCQGHEHAVREFSELLLCLLEKQFEVIEERAGYSDKYMAYKEAKDSVTTSFFKYEAGKILEG